MKTAARRAAVGCRDSDVSPLKVYGRHVIVKQSARGRFPVPLSLLE